MIKLFATALVGASVLTTQFAPPPAAGGLQIGDAAPPLSIVEWVKGRPIDLKRDAKRKIHVVEFWAVWCPPCKMSVPLLTELQKKYKSDVVIVGVTEPDMRGNSPAAVRQFVKDMGKDMEYTVAIDDGKTARTYMSGVEMVGIPHAFVVNRQGRIVWQGSPLEPALDEVLGQLVAGEFDLESAKIEQEVNKRLQELDLYSQLGQWSVVWDGLKDILKLDPGNEFAMEVLMRISIDQLQNTDEFRAWVRSHIAAHRDDAKAMHRLASVLCSVGDLAQRSPDLALEAARASYEASRQREAEAIAAYARALYQIGQLDRAIALQQDAVALAHGAKQEESRSVLDYYRRCKKLQETVK